MDGKVCLYVSLAGGLVLLSAACGRRPTPAAGAAGSDHTHAVNSPHDAGVAGKIPTAFGTADPSQGTMKGISPFPDLPRAEPPKTLPVPNLNANAHRTSEKAARVLKPFKPPTEIASVKRQEIQPALPPPPALGTPLNSPASPLFAEMPGTIATADYEPATPRGIRRIFHGLTGNRKGAAVTGGKNFVPPKPVRAIQLMLPPGATAALVKKKEMTVKAEIDASGRVTRVELLSPRDEQLATLTGYAASHWTFAPAKLDDQAVPGEVILYFDFSGSPATAKAAR